MANTATRQRYSNGKFARGYNNVPSWFGKKGFELWWDTIDVGNGCIGLYHHDHLIAEWKWTPSMTTVTEVAIEHERSCHE